MLEIDEVRGGVEDRSPCSMGSMAAVGSSASARTARRCGLRGEGVVNFVAAEVNLEVQAGSRTIRRHGVALDVEVSLGEPPPAVRSADMSSFHSDRSS